MDIHRSRVCSCITERRGTRPSQLCFLSPGQIWGAGFASCPGEGSSEADTVQASEPSVPPAVAPSPAAGDSSSPRAHEDRAALFNIQNQVFCQCLILPTSCNIVLNNILQKL